MDESSAPPNQGALAIQAIIVGVVAAGSAMLATMISVMFFGALVITEAPDADSSGTALGLFFVGLALSTVTSAGAYLLAGIRFVRTRAHPLDLSSQVGVHIGSLFLFVILLACVAVAS